MCSFLTGSEWAVIAMKTQTYVANVGNFHLIEGTWKVMEKWARYEIFFLVIQKFLFFSGIFMTIVTLSVTINICVRDRWRKWSDFHVSCMSRLDEGRYGMYEILMGKRVISIVVISSIFTDNYFWLTEKWQASKNAEKKEKQTPKSINRNLFV